jgi:hypothetical protein
MAKFTLTISTDGAAFSDGMGGREEVARLLTKVASRVADTDEANILDTNGNTCGRWEFIDE